MKYYYAIFTKTKKAVEVEFPDLPGCVTFGKNWEEALINAEDVLAGWLANAEDKFIHAPSKHNELEHLKGELVPVTINAVIVESYQKLKRINVIFPVDVLKRIDAFRKKSGMKRSAFLLKAAEEYIKAHSSQQLS
jgi:predicted RNase H-like HicB family nuclease